MVHRDEIAIRIQGNSGGGRDDFERALAWAGGTRVVGVTAAAEQSTSNPGQKRTKRLEVSLADPSHGTHVVSRSVEADEVFYPVRGRTPRRCTPQSLGESVSAAKDCCLPRSLPRPQRAGVSLTPIQTPRKEVTGRIFTPTASLQEGVCRVWGAYGRSSWSARVNVPSSKRVNSVPETSADSSMGRMGRALLAGFSSKLTTYMMPLSARGEDADRTGVVPGICGALGDGASDDGVLRLICRFSPTPFDRQVESDRSPPRASAPHPKEAICA